MKIGDLVRYIPANRIYQDNLYGIVLNIGTIDGYFTVAWNDGSYDEDLVYSELELVNEC